jgi:hypothetical protein
MINNEHVKVTECIKARMYVNASIARESTPATRQHVLLREVQAQLPVFLVIIVLGKPVDIDQDAKVPVSNFRILVEVHQVLLQLSQQHP